MILKRPFDDLGMGFFDPLKPYKACKKHSPKTMWFPVFPGCESAPSAFFILFHRPTMSNFSSSVSAPWVGMGPQRHPATCRKAAWCHETTTETSAQRRCSRHDRIGPEIAGDLRDVNSKRRPGNIEKQQENPVGTNEKKRVFGIQTPWFSCPKPHGSEMFWIKGNEHQGLKMYKYHG